MSEYFEDKDFDINDLNKISLLGNEFDNCNLANSSFFEIDLTKCKLIGCDLSNVDFSSSDLTQIK